MTNKTEQKTASPWLTFLLALSCGLIVANLYYAQPLAGPIAEALNLPLKTAGLVVTLTQIGYGLGLLFIVPIGDLIENRRLVLMTMALGTLGLIGAALSTSPSVFFIAAFFMGLGSVAVQILVPYAAHMATDATRGKMVGNVMSGLMLGIMLARPISSFVAEFTHWNTIFYISTVVMIILALVLRKALPQRVPTSTISYGKLLGSMWQLLKTSKPLQRRGIYQASLFGVFAMFWTAVPFLLTHTFHLSQGGIALFALAGVAGAIASPIAGRIADRGYIKQGSAISMLMVAVAYLITLFAQQDTTLSLAALVIAAILLDYGVTSNLVLGQRVIFSLGAELRSRLNGLFMAIFFVGGAIGSALGGWSYAHGGWSLTAWIGIVLPLLAFAYFLTEKKN